MYVTTSGTYRYLGAEIMNITACGTYNYYGVQFINFRSLFHTVDIAQSLGILKQVVEILTTKQSV